MPDDDLLAAADGGQLKTPEQASPPRPAACWAAPRRARPSSRFFEQWLQIDDLLTVEKDAMAYPAFNPQVRTAMRDEVYEFVDQVDPRRRRQAGDPADQPLLLPGGPLYAIYGLPMPGRRRPIQKKVDLPADQRAGLLTLAGRAGQVRAPQPELARRPRRALVSEQPAVHRRRPPPDASTATARARSQRVHPGALRAAPQGSGLRHLPRADRSAGRPLRDLRRHRPFRTKDGGKAVDATAS